MSKIPNDPKEIFEEITEDYKRIFGNGLISIILYGSAVGRDYRPGKSDINFMVVLSEEEIDYIEKAFKTVSRWQKRKVAIPLFLTERYIETSTDVFPIEYINFKHNYTLVYGEDFLKDLVFDLNDVRLQCEREIKGKLLILREAYMESAGKGKALREVIKHSLQAFTAIFRALLYLKRIEIPAENRKLIKAACDVFKLDHDLFEKLLDIKNEKIKPVDAEMITLFQNYLKQVRKLSRRVDEL